VSNKIDLRAHGIVWDAVALFMQLRKSEGASLHDASIEIVAALMDSSARINIMRGLDTAAYVKIAHDHYESTREMMREDLARTSN
jgi:hypothetical protein